jgi:hypothetical protein
MTVFLLDEDRSTIEAWCRENIGVPRPKFSPPEAGAKRHSRPMFSPALMGLDSNSRPLQRRLSRRTDEFAWSIVRHGSGIPSLSSLRAERDRFTPLMPAERNPS